MPKTASEGKSKKKKTPPQPVIVVTGKNAFAWLLSLFVVCGCMFVIGVLVGRDQAPIRFDTNEWEQNLEDLKISVLAKQEEFRESIEHIEILDYLKEKGKSIQFYKQYIPPILSPKYGKAPPPPDTRPVAGESPLPEGPGEQMVAMTDLQPPAPEKEVSTPAESPISADIAVISAEGSPMDAPESADTETTSEATAGQAPVLDASETLSGQMASEDLEKPLPGADGVIVTKTPATTKPAVLTASAPPPQPPAPVVDEAETVIETTRYASSEFVMDKPTAEATTDMPPVETAVLPECKDPAASMQYAIQVASLREQGKADTVRDKFRSRGYPAYCQSSEVRGVLWHRVRIGPYPDRHTADQDCRRLKEVGVDALIFVLER